METKSNVSESRYTVEGYTFAEFSLIDKTLTKNQERKVLHNCNSTSIANPGMINCPTMRFSKEFIFIAINQTCFNKLPR